MNMKQLLACLLCLLMLTPLMGMAEETPSGGDLVIGMVGDP